MVKFKIFGCNPWRFNLWHGSRRGSLREKREQKTWQSIECRALACGFWQLLTASGSFTYSDLLAGISCPYVPYYAYICHICHACSRSSQPFHELYFLIPYRYPTGSICCLTKCFKKHQMHLLLRHFVGEAKLLSLAWARPGQDKLGQVLVFVRIKGRVQGLIQRRTS